jgi:hypothetical protein
VGFGVFLFFWRIFTQRQQKNNNPVISAQSVFFWEKKRAKNVVF